MKKHLAIIISLLAIVVTLGITVSASAHQKHHGNYPTPTPTITFNPCDVEEGALKYDVGENPCVTPTVTPEATPSATPTPGEPGNPPTFQGSTTNAPGASSCTVPFKAPSTPMFSRVSPTSVTFAWWTSTDAVDSQDIEYGYSANNLGFGVALPASSGSYTIDHLASNQTIFARVCAFKNGCSACTEVVDP